MNATVFIDGGYLVGPLPGSRSIHDGRWRTPPGLVEERPEPRQDPLRPDVIGHERDRALPLRATRRGGVLRPLDVSAQLALVRAHRGAQGRHPLPALHEPLSPCSPNPGSALARRRELVAAGAKGFGSRCPGLLITAHGNGGKRSSIEPQAADRFRPFLWDRSASDELGSTRVTFVQRAQVRDVALLRAHIEDPFADPVSRGFPWCAHGICRSSGGNSNRAIHGPRHAGESRQPPRNGESASAGGLHRHVPREILRPRGRCLPSGGEHSRARCADESPILGRDAARVSSPFRSSLLDPTRSTGLEVSPAVAHHSGLTISPRVWTARGGRSARGSRRLHPPATGAVPTRALARLERDG